MNVKKALLSLATLVVVGSAVVGGTLAFYSDTETSEGNIFTAGSVDLRVDHLRQTYNGVDCETCSLTLQSGEGETDVVDSSDDATVQTDFPYTAPLVSDPHDNWAEHDTAEWIWAESSTSENDATTEVEYTFERTFQWNGVAGGVDFQMALGSDNGFAIYLNGTPLVDNLGVEDNYSATFEPLSGHESDFLDAVELGENTLTIVVRNQEPDGFTGTPESNPGGLLYYLNLEREDCDEDSSFQRVCQLWSERDLDGSQTFFNFGDIKPGDMGSNVISLHVGENDAYSCLLVSDGQDDENTLLESETGDTTEEQGELQNYINFFAWIDDDNEGNYNPDNDTALGTYTLGELDSIASLDGEQFLQATTTTYIGLKWCAGDITEVEGELICDGSGMKNDAQSDSFSASLTAYAEQVRNNEDFQCSSDLLEPEEPQQDAD